MHAISYQFKRCHLSAVAFGRRMFRGTREPHDPDFDGVPDMTPARFDILFLVLGNKIPLVPEPRAIEMARLCKILGLARATISKAVKRLVQLGLVTCEHSPANMRNKIVALTEEGEARIKRAMQLVFTGRELARRYRRYIARRFDGLRPRDRPQNLPELIHVELDEIWTELRNLAGHLYDRSEFLYDRQLRAPYDPY